MKTISPIIAPFILIATLAGCANPRVHDACVQAGICDPVNHVQTWDVICDYGGGSSR